MPRTLTLDQARMISAASRTKGQALGLKLLSVAVLDTGGDGIVFEREDGAPSGRCGIAQGKANGAVMLGRAGHAQMARAEAQGFFMGAVNDVWCGQVVPVAGGVLLCKGGVVIGAVRATGDTFDNDAEATLAGAVAAGLEAQA